MQVLGVARFLAEAGVVIGQETRQQLIAGGNRGGRYWSNVIVTFIATSTGGARPAPRTGAR
jgi:hypothetical protein